LKGKESENQPFIAIVFIVFGALVLVFTAILHWLVGIFFIVIGILATVRK